MLDDGYWTTTDFHKHHSLTHSLTYQGTLRNTYGVNNVNILVTECGIMLENVVILFLIHPPLRKNFPHQYLLFKHLYMVEKMFTILPNLVVNIQHWEVKYFFMTQAFFFIKITGLKPQQQWLSRVLLRPTIRSYSCLLLSSDRVLKLENARKARKRFI